jgi:hypothetical protein
MPVRLEFNLMRALMIVFIWLIVAHVAHAEELDGLTQRAAMTHITAEKIQFASNENMGLLGANYLVETLPNLYLGGAVYGALTGQRGGFFTIGSELAWHQKFNDVWAWETGIYAGGGGGGSANSQVGGGLMLRPHVDLLRNFGSYNIGVSMAQVRFPSGTINSTQLGLVLAANTDFLQVSKLSQPLSKTLRTGVGFDRVHAVVASYQGQIFAQTKVKNKVGLVGFRMEQLRTENLFWGIEASGAATGYVGHAKFGIAKSVDLGRSYWGRHGWRRGGLGRWWTVI